MKRMYEYSRGDQYYCKIYVTPDERLLFLETRYPEGANDEMKQRFLEDAERSILNLIEKEFTNEGYYGIYE